MTPAQRIAVTCAWSARLLGRHLSGRVVGFVKDNRDPAVFMATAGRDSALLSEGKVHGRLPHTLSEAAIDTHQTRASINFPVHQREPRADTPSKQMGDVASTDGAGAAR